MQLEDHKKQLREDGFTVIENVFSEVDTETLLNAIKKADASNATFRKSADVFAIRQFLIEVPETIITIYSSKLKTIIQKFFGSGYFVTKSIYFDKHEQSNWFVAYHQDLTISVDKKLDLEHFGPWTVKQNQFAVQPPLHILEDNFTIRIHLDDTNEDNGALKVIPKSHSKGIYRPETIDWNSEKETICSVGKGGIMIMRPLLLHSSGRTTNNKKRRVIHIEFGSQSLPQKLNWSEQVIIEK